MNESERDQLAKRLSALSFKQVRREMRDIDPDADLKFFRNSIWDEFHTLWVLPNAQLSIILVEKRDLIETNLEDHTAARGRRKQQKADYTYVEARVDELKRPAAKF